MPQYYIGDKLYPTLRAAALAWKDGQVIKASVGTTGNLRTLTAREVNEATAIRLESVKANRELKPYGVLPDQKGK